MGYTLILWDLTFAFETSFSNILTGFILVGLSAPKMLAPKIKGHTWRIIPFSKWLGSPPFISHKKAIWKGSHNPILRGLTITMVTKYLYWDDPPSRDRKKELSPPRSFIQRKPLNTWDAMTCSFPAWLWGSQWLLPLQRMWWHPVLRNGMFRWGIFCTKKQVNQTTQTWRHPRWRWYLAVWLAHKTLFGSLTNSAAAFFCAISNLFPSF